MTWRGLAPLIQEITATDARGVKLTRTVFRAIAERLKRDKILPKWSLVIPTPSG